MQESRYLAPFTSVWAFLGFVHMHNFPFSLPGDDGILRKGYEQFMGTSGPTR
jgi:hypothetical protein